MAPNISRRKYVRRREMQLASRALQIRHHGNEDATNRCKRYKVCNYTGKQKVQRCITDKRGRVTFVKFTYSLRANLIRDGTFCI